MKTLIDVGRARVLALVIPALLASGAPAELDRVEPALIGGASDTADPSTVFIFVLPTGKMSGANCTGVVVSPHVVLTAAHCVAPSVLVPVLGAGYDFFVYLGDDAGSVVEMSKPGAIARVKTTAFDPLFTIDPFNHTAHDIGAIVTETPMAVSPMALNREPLGQDLVGAAIRVLGYGMSSPGLATSVGVRREGTTMMAGLDDEHLWFGSDGIYGCQGDSGGPTLISRNGVDSVVGIHSWDQNGKCDAYSFDTRVDVDAVPFVTPLVAMYDPSYALPGDGTSDGGTSDGALTDGGAEPPHAAGCELGGSPPSSAPLWCVLLLFAYVRRRATG